MKKDFAGMTVQAITKYLTGNLITPAELKRLKQDRRAGVRQCVERYLAARASECKEEERLAKLQEFERQARARGYTYIAGVDEAGRGPLAGPVVAAAVILPEGRLIRGINDSKQLTPAKRAELYNEITATAIAWSVGIGEVAEIDSVNIYNANKMAMSRALKALAVSPDYVLIDAVRLDGLECPQQAIIGGDRLSASIAAASIIAKVVRDRWMCEMDKVFPGYGFSVNKGYATAEHRSALARLGPCPAHRKSFLLLREEK